MSNKSSKNNKPILFYSDYCEYSKSIYQTLTKLNVLNDFLLINITNGKYKTPSIIKQVPTILLSDLKTKIEDNNLEDYINKLKKNNVTNVEPLYNDGGSISNQYSFWNENDNDKLLSNQYGLISDMVNSKPLNIEDNDENFNKMNNSLNDKMNSLQEERANDIKNLFNNKPNVNLL